MSNSFDVAVIGAGVFGSWTAYHLNQAGLSVLLIDGYGSGNSRSSSGGESRIIRMGYGPDEIYTRWSSRALGMWANLSERTGGELFHRTGVLWMARENDAYTTATLKTFERTRVLFEVLRRDELEKRFPQISFGEISWAIFEPDSGVLMARRAVQALAREVIVSGTIFMQASVLSPTGKGSVNELRTHSGIVIKAGTYVFACGPWLPKLFPDLLGNRINPTRQEVYFFGTRSGDSRFKSPDMPAWIDFGSETYGIPDIENRGFKVALDRHGEAIDPDEADRYISSDLLQTVREFLGMRFPSMRDARLIESRVCQYENTSDGNFLIDRHPDFDNVWLVGGGSGHGFKHGPVLGEYVKSLIVDGKETDSRFSLETKQELSQRTVY